MTRLRRRILFWLSVIIFFAVVVPVVLYSFGYRFSLKDWKISRAGGLAITSVPSTGTKIFINGKLERETTLLFRSLFLQGLTPGVYDIWIEKEGYFPWGKRLRVLPEKVTTVEALLVKQNPDDGTILVKDHYTTLRFLDTNQETIVLQDTKKRAAQYSLRDEALVPIVARATATTTEPIPADIRKFLSEKKIKNSDYDASLGRLLWWDASHVWIRWLRGEEFLPLYTEEPEMLVFSSPAPVRSVSFYPAREASIVAYSNTVSVIELDGRDHHNIYPLYKGKEPSFLVSENQKKVYILDDGNLISIPIL